MGGMGGIGGIGGHGGPGGGSSGQTSMGAVTEFKYTVTGSPKDVFRASKMVSGTWLMVASKSTGGINVSPQSRALSSTCYVKPTTGVPVWQ